MLFLTDVDHVSFEKANGTRQNNLQSATVSLQVVIGLCKRKETAALISQNRRFKWACQIVVCAPSSRQLKKYRFFATQIMLGSIFMLP